MTGNGINLTAVCPERVRQSTDPRLLSANVSLWMDPETYFVWDDWFSDFCFTLEVEFEQQTWICVKEGDDGLSLLS